MIGIVPRDYQREAAAKVGAAFNDGARRVVLVAPTGSGKGTMGVLEVERALGACERVVWFTHRVELIGDTSARLDRLGLPHGVVRPNSARTDPSAPAQLATIQTLMARGERPPGDLLVCDEAHHITAASYRVFVEAYPNARILGLTATPERADGAALGGMFERMVVAATVRELTARGFLVPCDVIGPARRRDTLPLSPAEAVAKYAAGRRVIVFGKSTLHARALADELGGVCIEGGMAPRKRAEMLMRFARGDLRVLTNVHVLTEGWDCPEAEVCVLARGCSSVATYLQIVGRVLRPSAHKARALVVDLFGCVHEHGLPDEARTFSLEGRAIRRAASLPALQRCETCLALFAPRESCPRCGAAAKPTAAPASPAKLDREELQRISATIPREEKQGYFNWLCSRRREERRQHWWVAKLFEAKYHHAPNGYRDTSFEKRS
jgi:DNA repair protein RadD